MKVGLIHFIDTSTEETCSLSDPDESMNEDCEETYEGWFNPFHYTSTETSLNGTPLNP